VRFLTALGSVRSGEGEAVIMAVGNVDLEGLINIAIDLGSFVSRVDPSFPRVEKGIAKMRKVKPATSAIYDLLGCAYDIKQIPSGVNGQVVQSWSLWRSAASIENCEGHELTNVDAQRSVAC
jgi:hypothetical protein